MRFTLNIEMDGVARFALPDNPMEYEQLKAQFTYPDDWAPEQVCTSIANYLEKLVIIQRDNTPECIQLLAVVRTYLRELVIDEFRNTLWRDVEKNGYTFEVAIPINTSAGKQWVLIEFDHKD